MKNILSIIFLTVVLAGCTSDDNSSSTNNSQTIAELTNIASSGSWVVTSYIDSGTNETNHFTGYTFTFNSGGSLVASNGQTSITGTWSVTSSNSGDDSSSSDDIDFNIYFASPDNFEDLTDDWHIQNYTSTTLQLIDVSGGNGGTDYLTFQKN